MIFVWLCYPTFGFQVSPSQGTAVTNYYIPLTKLWFHFLVGHVVFFRRLPSAKMSSDFQTVSTSILSAWSASKSMAYWSRNMIHLTMRSPSGSSFCRNGKAGKSFLRASFRGASKMRASRWTWFWPEIWSYLHHLSTEWGSITCFTRRQFFVISHSLSWLRIPDKIIMPAFVLWPKRWSSVGWHG